MSTYNQNNNMNTGSGQPPQGQGYGNIRHQNQPANGAQDAGLGAGGAQGPAHDAGFETGAYYGTGGAPGSNTRAPVGGSQGVYPSGDTYTGGGTTNRDAAADPRYVSEQSTSAADPNYGPGGQPAARQQAAPVNQQGYTDPAPGTTAGTNTGTATPAGGATGTAVQQQSVGYGKGAGENPNLGTEAGNGLKGVFAKGHGVGEVLRGNLNEAISTFTNDKSRHAENEGIIRKGQNEYANERFEHTGPGGRPL